MVCVFVQDIFMDAGLSSRAKGSVGNTKADGEQGWGTSEGLVTDGKAAEFCDGIADWWPEVGGVCMLGDCIHWVNALELYSLCKGFGIVSIRQMLWNRIH